MQRWAIVVLCIITFGIVGGFVAVSREQQCRAPWQAVLLDDAALDTVAEGLPPGWQAGAPGVRVGQFSVDGGHSVHMLGIGTWLGLPALSATPGGRMCVSAQALADSVSATAVRTRWIWTLRDGGTIEQVGPWHPVRAWAGSADQDGWSRVVDTTIAPPNSASVRVRFEPASDDRVYLDHISMRAAHVGQSLPQAPAVQGTPLRLRPWPAGYSAAVSFSYDFESAMGGLVHSRSVDDPNAALDPLIRAKRMRAGLWESLELFAPYGVHATYYVNGYNFLDENPTRRTFMGDPTFTWATKANGWQTDIWSRQPWFSVDPYSAAHPASDWYFGDLIAPLRAAGHSVESHTFAHFYGGYASAAEWQADIAAWNALAAAKGIAPATSLAFPWSSSAGMPYANWEVLADAGFTSVTRTAWNPKLPQYHIVSAAAATCRPLPGHERITVCPDYYLTVARTPGALKLLADIRTRDGMIDFWAHTEEVTTPEQIAAWRSVVDAAAGATDVWVAPLAEIAARQRAIWTLQTTTAVHEGRATVIVHNPSDVPVTDVAYTLDAQWQRAAGQPAVLTIPAHGQVSIELVAP